MRILGVGASCDLADVYMRLDAAGHEVKVYIRDYAQLGVMDGMLQRVSRWRDELAWIRGAGRDGVIVFEDAEHGAEQDALRAEGYFVIGGSAFGDRLENDRTFAQETLAKLGMKTALTVRFESFSRAIEHIREHPKRYVLKWNGSKLASHRSYVGRAGDGSDVIAWLADQAPRLRAIGMHRTTFVLMEHLSGVETGVGAYFNGEQFLQPACLDWEHKHFFPGELGELTGEMGTLVSYEHAQRIFDRTLGRLQPLLSESGYVGYINLNTIINEDGIWPLELTCRFGYPGTSILGRLQNDGWGTLFRMLIDRERITFAVQPGYAVGVVLCVPPFPYSYGYAELSKGLPIHLDPTLSEIERAQLCLMEVAMRGRQWIASGSTGCLMVATGTGADPAAAQAAAYALASKVHVPNLRYRNDIGDAFIRSGHGALKRLGLLP